MFIILLTFSENKALAGQFMDGHKGWLKQGFDDGIFLLAGSIKPGRGGAILAQGGSLEELEDRVNLDPFVKENVVQAELLEIESARTDDRLAFLLD